MTENYRRRRKFPKLKLIETVFRREREIRQAVRDVREDIVAPEHNGGSSGFISSPTETQALKNLIPLKSVTLSDGFVLEYPERWLVVIDKTYKLFDADGREIFRLASSGVYFQKVCNMKHISSGTFYNILRDGQNYAIAIACQLHLIDIIDMAKKEEKNPS